MTARAIELLAHNSDAIVAKAVELAKSGDALALRLCVERIVPARAARDRVAEVDLPPVVGGQVADLVAAAAAVVDHAAHGRITLSEAKEFMSLLEAERKLVETQELVVRIEALEGSARREAAVSDAFAELSPDLRSRVRFLEPR